MVTLTPPIKSRRIPLIPGLLFVLLLGGVAQSEPLLKLEKGWRFSPDPKGEGEQLGWHLPEFEDSSWATLEAGKRWEDQGYPDLDGKAWYRIRFEVPADWKGGPAWLVFGGVNDAYVLYCNGVRVNSYGTRTSRTVAQTQTIAELSAWLQPGKTNLIAVCVDDFGGNGGLWRLPCALTNAPALTPYFIGMETAMDYEHHALVVDLDMAVFGNDQPRRKIVVEVHEVQGAWKDRREVTREAGHPTETFTFALPESDKDRSYMVHPTVRSDEDGQFLMPPIPSEIAVEWKGKPTWPAPHKNLKVLNNFVTELASGTLPAGAKDRISFPNPRRGWVFFSAHGKAGARLPQAPRAHLENSTEPVLFRQEPNSGAWEAMRFLSEGSHRLTVETDSETEVRIRAIPEIGFCYYPTSAHIPQHGPYDWAYMTRHVLSNVNVLITSGGAPEAEIHEWLKEGRRWVINTGLPGLYTPPPTPEEVFEGWAKVPQVSDPNYAGMIVDEFIFSRDAHYPAWTEAMERIVRSDFFKGKTFYGFCNDLYLEPDSRVRAFCKKLAELDGRFAVEKYIPERPTEEEAAQLLRRELQAVHRGWKKFVPGWEKVGMYTLGYFSAPPEGLNVLPSVNYRVFMEMQFRLLATDPTFFGLYGLMEYLVSYADEENVRWAHQLFRHYCIEGKTERLSPDPYLLPHLVNPDFADGLAGWDVAMATPESVRTEEMKDFSWLQGRYPPTTIGDRFALLLRSEERPNKLSQSLKALEPGRLYSLKLLSADLARLDQKTELPFRIDLEGVERVEDLCFRTVYPHCYSHNTGPFTPERPAYFNYHRLVFRAKGTEGRVTLSDWLSDTEAGGTRGQRLALNFVEVQPYLEP
ncbi:MAG: hypothetical protein GHCLOJNM_02578 [bacterium]|nr:hypothetical protein [bacterium]